MKDQTKENDNIFKDDLFERDKFIDQVASIIEQLVEIGGAVAINGGFGMGKTWLCDKFLEYLKVFQPEYKTVKIDAFLHDFENEPFIPIHLALSSILEQNDSPLKRKCSQFKEVGKKVLKSFSLQSLKLIPVVGEVAAEVSTDIFDYILDTENSLEKKVESYKDELRKLTKNSKVIVFIDELDRCKPVYALSLLERIKHYFEISNIIFVLMINIDQLTTIIKHTYGHNEKQAIEYLEKFWICTPIDLPNSPLINTFDQNFTFRNYYSLFNSSIYSKMFKMNINQLSSTEEFGYIGVLSKISGHMGLNYREQIGVNCPSPLKGTLRNSPLVFLYHFLFRIIPNIINQDLTSNRPSSHKPSKFPTKRLLNYL